MEISFAHRRVLVTGAGRGIGRAIACLLATLDATVVAVSRTEADLRSLADEVSSKGGAGSVIPVVCDLADPEQTAERIAAQLPIDLVVNNAGSSTLHSFLDTPLAEFDRTLNVNLRGVLHVSQIVARDMVRRRHEGDRAPFAFVNISSQASKVALLNHTSYCCSKGGLDQLTRMMALELGPHQIRVNSVNPTVVLTDMGKMAWSDESKSKPMLARIPQGKFAEEQDVARAVCYLLSDKADMINGAFLPIDGGFLAC